MEFITYIFNFYILLYGYTSIYLNRLPYVSNVS